MDHRELRELDGRGRCHANQLEREQAQKAALAQIDIGPGIDAEAREKAEGWIAELADSISRVEHKVALLRGFCDGDLAGAIVGHMGTRAEELRQQIRPLREAVRGMER